MHKRGNETPIKGFFESYELVLIFWEKFFEINNFDDTDRNI